MNCKNMMKRLGAILICASLMCTINVANVFAETNENVDIRFETAELTAEPTEVPEESYPPVPEIRESVLNTYQLREWKEEWSDVE